MSSHNEFTEEQLRSMSSKQLHEMFVTGHGGSEWQDVLQTLFPVIPASLLTVLLTKGKSSR